uniref:CD80-like immunoglobulin C2-set domain-containing protein n=1 Tax=Periophthalmus magnuspinnatus TaxID=409849 RepID=A0A3B4BBE1_9GOBI
FCLLGHVGGEVVFQCFKPHEKYKLLYLQRGEDFVNGYYESKSMSLYKPWPNSRVNKTQNAISLSTLNVSHAGQYTCYCESTKGLQNQTEIELIITANYSKPSIHHNCTDKKDQCLVWCSSHGGYPKNKIIWNVTTLEGPPIAMMWRNDSFKEDNNTQLFNISSMASFNCSTGKQNISCSVDGVSSVLSPLFFHIHILTCSICVAGNISSITSNIQYLTFCNMWLLIVVLCTCLWIFYSQLQQCVQMYRAPHVIN